MVYRFAKRIKWSSSMKSLKFIKVKTLPKTLSFLSVNRNKCKIIAGGTDLIIQLRNKNSRNEKIEFIIDISHLAELKGISFHKKYCSIGANTTFSEIIKSKKMQDNFPLLWNASKKIGSPQIRNIATIGGNICNLASAADSIPPLLVYDAKMKIVSSKDEKLIPLEKILKSPQKIDLQHNQIISEIIMPINDEDKSAQTKFYKLGRRKGMSVSRMSFAILLKINEKNRIADFRIAAGAIFQIPKRLYKIEKDVKGKIFGDKLCKKISVNVGKQVLSETGIRWSTPYKLPTLQQVLYKILIDFL